MVSEELGQNFRFLSPVLTMLGHFLERGGAVDRDADQFWAVLEDQ